MHVRCAYLRTEMTRHARTSQRCVVQLTPTRRLDSPRQWRSVCNTPLKVFLTRPMLVNWHPLLSVRPSGTGNDCKVVHTVPAWAFRGKTSYMSRSHATRRGMCRQGAGVAACMFLCRSACRPAGRAYSTAAHPPPQRKQGCGTPAVESDLTLSACTAQPCHLRTFHPPAAHPFPLSAHSHPQSCSRRAPSHTSCQWTRCHNSCNPL